MKKKTPTPRNPPIEKSKSDVISELSELLLNESDESVSRYSDRIKRAIQRNRRKGAHVTSARNMSHSFEEQEDGTYVCKKCGEVGYEVKRIDAQDGGVYLEWEVESGYGAALEIDPIQNFFHNRIRK